MTFYRFLLQLRLITYNHHYNGRRLSKDGYIFVRLDLPGKAGNFRVYESASMGAGTSYI